MSGVIRVGSGVDQGCDPSRTPRARRTVEDMSYNNPYAPQRTLRRPRRGRLIAGVCAGIADRFGMSRNVVRVLFLVSCLLPGPQILFYLGAWLLIPSED